LSSKNTHRTQDAGIPRTPFDHGVADFEAWAKGWNDRIYNDHSINPDITLGELLLVYFEWMSVHKVTDAAAKAVYNLLLMLLPPDTNAGSWSLSKKLLRKVCESRVVKIETCPNDCVAFIDCKHHKLRHYQHSHRSCCPKCGADRWLTRADGRKRSAKVVYHLPAGPWLRDLFRDSEVAPFLASDYAQQPPGHVTKSRGWHKKVRARIHILVFCTLCTIS
jgi:hypothetical protein